MADAQAHAAQRDPGDRRTAADEIANALTHGVGLIASLVGVPVLLLSREARGDLLSVIGAAVFGASLVAVYATSTFYHAVPHPRAKRVLQLLDHIAIYLLIAGTYTPFTLGVLRGAWGWTLFGIVWTLAALGILFTLCFQTRFKRLSTLLYLAMGWVAIVAVEPLLAALPGAGFALLIGGGVLYTAGTLFYMRDHRRFHHATWHCFVLGGSTCHFFAVLRFA
ncbi:MAG: hemolysin III family protein [Gemmatimonadaceae bacterium]|nr:hemolysin III family protein [Gemmatimonadaceae bacterium]